MIITKRGKPCRLPITTDMDSSKLFELVGRNTGNLLFNYAVSKLLNFPKEKLWTAPADRNEIGIYPMANQSRAGDSR